MKQRSTACPDWERRIIGRESLIASGPLFPSEADAAIAVMGELRIVDAPGSPRIADACRPWALEFAGALFGSYDPDTGRRMIREYMLSVSKKNWKSGLAASIMLTALIRNWRESGEFLILAPTVEVANNAFHPCRDMVRADEELSALLHVQEHLRQITHRQTGATLKVVAADSEAVGGKKAIGVLVDELWLFGKKPNAENMLREATGGMASRPEGFTVYLTTQSDEPPAGVFRSKLQYARGVRDGRIDDPQFLPVLYEFPEAMLKAQKHRDPEHFYVTNPNLGASVDEAFLKREFRKAEEGGEESMRGFMSKHLNVEIGLALRSDRWPGADFWQPAADEQVTLDYIIEHSDVIDVGIDGGGLDDLLGLAVVGRHAETKCWMAWTHAWAHLSVLERRKQEAARLDDFRAQGNLTVVECIGQDATEVAEIVARVEQAELLDKAGVDPVGIGAILDELVEAGVPQDKVIGVSQGWRLSGAIKTTERKLADRGLVHGGQPLMDWCVSNARVEPRGNAILITKQASGSAKIDPLMALFNAISLMSLNPASAKRKYQMFVLGR